MLSSVPTRAVACAILAAATSVAPTADPVVHDAHLELSLFAAAPEIVTPVGIAIDARDRVFVLESHTHLQPPGYPGPRGDRIKVFTDADGDGRAERITVFADALDDGMNIAFSPDGDLYVVASRAVWALHDRNKDGVSESRTRILAMTRPERVYDHAALLGLAFSPDGWLYLSRGNTGGAAWRIEGRDGSSVGGYGDGGSILRCRPDGTDLQAFASGFWNPFALAFDPDGRLLATDNDPDSRGPNRLLHVIPGGDYGYKSLYGESGIHPYLAWNGELPGTLPYAAALGEAPSGLVHGALTGLPADYGNALLIAIWEERRIVRVPLVPRGASVTGTATPLIDGDETFRPVALGADRRGAVFITDWGLRQYPNHGKGRIWRLAARQGVSRQPRAITSRVPRVDPAGPADSGSVDDIPRLRAALASDDPFVQSAAIHSLSSPRFRSAAADATNDQDPRVRAAAVVALHRGGHDAAEQIARRLVSDPDPLVRRMALIWIGSSGMAGLRDAIDAAIQVRPVPRELFETYLATIQHLTPEFIHGYRSQAAPYAKNLKRRLPEGFLAAFVAETTRPPSLRALAIAHLENPADAAPLLSRLAQTDSDMLVRMEAVRSLAAIHSREIATTLLAIAENPDSPGDLRAEAWLALTRQPSVDGRPAATKALSDPALHVRREAERYLRHARSREVRSAEEAAGPASDAEWMRATSEGGDPITGRRVFFSPASACSQCHAIEGRGGDLGPDLTNVGRSKTRAQILASILTPSAEISPEYQGWFVRTRDGQIYTGRQIDVGEGGRADLYVGDGFVQLREVVEYGPTPLSLMPDGLEHGLTVTDVRDLLAFLTHGEAMDGR